MKLAKIALTPPIAAISVALLAATSFGGMKYSTTLTVGARLTISGLDSVQLGDVIINDIGEADVSKFVAQTAMPEGLTLGKDDHSLNIAANIASNLLVTGGASRRSLQLSPHRPKPRAMTTRTARSA